MRLYRLEIEDKAERNLRDLPGRIQQEVTQILLDLRHDPYPPESEVLEREYGDLRKIKIDGWRILYKVYEQDRVVKVALIGPRNADTYRQIFGD